MCFASVASVHISVAGDAGVAGVELHTEYIPIGSMYGIYANIWGILMVIVSIYTIHGSYGIM
jgi:hypothetical protein